MGIVSYLRQLSFKSNLIQSNYWQLFEVMFISTTRQADGSGNVLVYI